MEDVGTFYVRLVYFTANLNILWPFCGNLVYFGMLYLEKSGNPGQNPIHAAIQKEPLQL
jgi:hypothetical protein